MQHEHEREGRRDTDIFREGAFEVYERALWGGTVSMHSVYARLDGGPMGGWMRVLHCVRAQYCIAIIGNMAEIPHIYGWREAALY